MSCFSDQRTATVGSFVAQMYKRRRLTVEFTTMLVLSLLTAAFASAGLAASTFDIAAEQGCLLVVEIFSYEKTNVPKTNFYRPHAAWSVCYTDSPPQEFTRELFSGDKGDVVIYGNLKPVNDKGKKLIDFSDMCIMGPDDVNEQGVLKSFLTDVGSSQFTFDAAGQMWETKTSGKKVQVPW